MNFKINHSKFVGTPACDGMSFNRKMKIIVQLLLELRCVKV